MSATHVVLIGVKGGNGVELATSKEHLDAFVAAHDEYLTRASGGHPPDTHPYKLDGFTQSGLPTVTRVHLQDVQFLNIVELPSEKRIATPRPPLVSM